MAEEPQSLREYLQWRATMSEEEFADRLGCSVLVQIQTGGSEGDALRSTTQLAESPSASHVAGARDAAPLEALVIPIRNLASFAFTDMISVGRVRGNDIVLEHPEISKFHAHFRKHASGEVFVADAGSINGTHVNRTPLTPYAPVALQDGDVVSFGGEAAFVYYTARGFHAHLVQLGQ